MLRLEYDWDDAVVIVTVAITGELVGRFGFDTAERLYAICPPDSEYEYIKNTPAVREFIERHKWE